MKRHCCDIKGKGKDHPITGHEGPGGEQKYSSTLSLISVARWAWSTSRADRFTPGKDPVNIVQKAGWAPGQVWTGDINCAFVGYSKNNKICTVHVLK